MEDAKTVRYVSKDPLQNLKVRVTLWRLSVQRSRVQLNNPNAGGQSQPQGQGIAQAQPQVQVQGQPQAQAQARAQEGDPAQQPQQQQPFPQPLAQPAYGPDGQPLPAAPARQGPVLQAEYVGAPPQPQPQPSPGLGQEPAQAVAESCNGVGARQGQRPPSVGHTSGATRQRMTVQQRLDAAAAFASDGRTEPPAAGPWGWGQAGGATAAVTDPFTTWAPQAAGTRRPVPIGQARPQGQPLGEAVEYSGDGAGSGDEDADAGLLRRRQRRQQVAQQAAAAAATDPAMEQQQQRPSSPQQAQQLMRQHEEQQQQLQQAAAAGQLQQQQRVPGPLQSQMPAPQPQLQQPQQPQAAAGLTGIAIPAQVVPKVVPYGSLGPEARMAATGQPPEVPPTTPQHELPEKFKTSRVFGWQEKVYSRTEVAAAQAAAAQAAVSGVPGAAWQQQQLGAAGQQEQEQQAAAGRSKRQQAFGSQSALDHKKLDLRTRGSILFTYVQTDDFCAAQELGRTVTTSPYEEENVLVTKLLSNPKGRAQVLSFRSMFIVADLGDETDVGAGNEKVLVSIRAFPDGSFDMCPGFSRPGIKYRFEDKHGGIFEYTVEHASASEVPSLERRTAKLERAVVARAEELRRAALKTDFEQPPAGDCTRLVVLGEILSAADFPRDRLYIEYVVRWDPELWELTAPWPQQEPGIAQGVTHISRVTVYPPDPATDTPARDVAHFAHPLELEWVSRGPQASPGAGPEAGGPPPNAYPCIFFQVCTLDPFNRYTCQGYGWLSLDGRVPGSGTHVIRTWKPLGTIRDRQAEFFVGGSPELADLAYLTTPSGFNGKILNKYGFKTESVGAIKVRLHAVTQCFNPEATALAALRRSAGASPLKGLGGGRSSVLGAGAAAAKRHPLQPLKKDLSLKMVVERARQRLREARGTDQLPGVDVGVRPGVVSEAPTIVSHPQDTVVSEDSTVRLKVVARGFPPLSYEWYKDDRRLLVATADQPVLVLVQASLDSEGAYHCQVSNKDGTATSSKATLTVTRAARVARAISIDPGRAPRRQQRSPTAPRPGSPLGGPGPAAPRMSRLSRLDAVASVRGGGGPGAASVAGSDVAGPMSVASDEQSQQELTAGAAGAPSAGATAAARPWASAAAADGSGPPPAQPAAPPPEAPGAAPLPPLPPSRLPPATSGASAVDAAGDGGGGSGGSIGGGFPSSVAAAAASGFQRRPPRSAGGGEAGSGSSGGGAAGAAAPPPAESDGVTPVSEVVEEVTGMARQRRRMPSSFRPAATPQGQPPLQPPQQLQPSQQPRRLPARRQDDDEDLVAEEIE